MVEAGWGRLVHSMRVDRFAKGVATLLVIGFFFSACISRLPFTTVSPDSIRFMHFAQINADRAVAEGGTLTSAMTATLRSIKGMNQVDYDRGRIVQAIVYGVDAMTRWMLPAVGLNLLMMLVLTINAGMVSRLATRNIPDPKQRLNIALLSWVFLLTSSLVISPAMLVTLYGKYVWVTFLLAHCLARRTGWKIFWLIPTAYSDEIGLIAVALVVFLHVRRMTMPDQPATAGWRRALRAAAIPIGAAGIVFLLYFGISALVFDTGAEGFMDMSVSQLRRGVILPRSIADADLGIFWRAELLLVGVSTRITAITVLLGVGVVALIGIAAVRQYRLSNGDLPFYSFWLVLFIVISWLILPGPAYELNQYSYPAAITLGLIFLRSLSDLLSPRRTLYLLGFLSAVHIALIPRISSETSSAVTVALLPDSTVSVADIQRLHRAVEQVRAEGRSAMLDSIDNGQEIDFSATWYYSRVRWFGVATRPHWPVQGTVRVLAWPARPKFRCVSREFRYTKGEFVDKPCTVN